MTDNTQPEAVMQLADAYADASFDQGLHKRTLDDAPENARSVLAAAVRRQHARIAELEAQLSAIGAGGVSGPLMGCASIAASAGSVEPAGEYPALPDAAGVVVERVPVGGGWVRHYQGDSYTADQMRAWADATCAMRAVQPAGALQTAPTAQTAPTPQAAPAAVAGQSAPGMQDAIRQYTEAQDALDNREYAGINAEPYDKLLRARNASRRDLEAALAAAHTPPAQAADSVLEDVVRLDWLLLHISGAEFRRIGVHYSGNARRADVDAARKQGGAA